MKEREKEDKEKIDPSFIVWVWPAKIPPIFRLSLCAVDERSTRTHSCKDREDLEVEWSLRTGEEGSCVKKDQQIAPRKHTASINSQQTNKQNHSNTGALEPLDIHSPVSPVSLQPSGCIFGPIPFSPLGYLVVWAEIMRLADSSISFSHGSLDKVVSFPGKK